ncbi:MAG: hypothetical protein ACO4CG_13690 [Prochlorothrix sp.]|nr:hypothetical protein [Prochlorothrix sp.]
MADHEEVAEDVPLWGEAVPQQTLEQPADWGEAAREAMTIAQGSAQGIAKEITKKIVKGDGASVLAMGYLG